MSCDSIDISFRTCGHLQPGQAEREWMQRTSMTSMPICTLSRARKFSTANTLISTGQGSNQTLGAPRGYNHHVLQGRLNEHPVKLCEHRSTSRWRRSPFCHNRAMTRCQKPWIHRLKHLTRGLLWRHAGKKWLHIQQSI